MKKMKKLLSVMLIVLLMGNVAVFAEEAANPTPIFEENFEGLVSNQENTDWYRNITYVSGGATTTNVYTGETVTVTNGDNFPSTVFTNESLGYMVKADPTNANNKVLNTGGYNVDKWLVCRDLPENTKSKVFEVWTYAGETDASEMTEYTLRVGEININILGSSFKTTSGFSYKVIGNTNEAISGVNYQDTTIEMRASDGWHQFVFDYTNAPNAVTIYLNGQTVATVAVSTQTNGSYNRAYGNRVVFGDGIGNNGVKNYCFDNIRVWNSEDLDYALSLAPTVPLTRAIFEEDLENWNMYGTEMTEWYRNSTYYGGGTTVTDVYTGESTKITNGDNFPSTAFNELSVGYMIKSDPTDATNKVLQPGGYNVDKWLIGRDLPYTNKVVEAWAYLDKDFPGEIDEFNLKVGEITISANGWNALGAGTSTDYNSFSGFSYKVTGGAVKEIGKFLYPGTNIPIFAAGRWHQFVFDYTNAPTEVKVYLNGTNILTTAVDTTKNGSYNRALGNRIVIGDAKDNNGVKNYCFDNIRMWNKESLSHVLSLAPSVPVATHTEGTPLYEQNFDEGFGFNGFYWLLTHNNTALWRMTTAEKANSTAAAPVIDEATNAGASALKTNTYVDTTSLLQGRLNGVSNNKVVDVWFYDDPDTYKADWDNEVFMNGGVFVGANRANFIGVEMFNKAFLETMPKYEDYYAVKLANDTAVTTTTVKRTKGWHRFVFDFSTPGMGNLYIDGTLVRSAAVSGDVDCGLVTFGDDRTDDNNNSTFYYDNLKVWETVSEVYSGEEVFSFNSCSFVDENGAPLTQLTANDKISAKFTFTNTLEKNYVAVPVLAVYEGNQLKSVAFGENNKIDFSWSGESVLTTNEITLPESVDGISIKAFVVNGWDGLVPVCPAQPFTPAQ